MNQILPTLRLLLLFIVISACIPEQETHLTEPVAGTDTSDRVAALAEEAWRQLLSQSPYLQVREGELIRELPDLTLEQANANVAFARSLLAQIEAMDAEALEPEDFLTLEVLRWDAQITIAGEPYYWLSFPFTPYMVGFGFNFAHEQLEAHPFSDAQAHPENYLVILGEYADLLEQLRTHVEGQMQRQIYVSRHALPGILGLFESFRELAPSVMTVAEERLEALDEDARGEFQEAVEQAIAERVLPAFDGFLDLLGSEHYAAKAPDTVGLSQYPEGEAYYRHLVRAQTTMEVTPEELHQLGQRRVAELEAKMAAIRDDLGFTGSKEAFHEALRSDRRFFASSPQEVEDRFKDYIARIEPLIPSYFRQLPGAPYGVERLDPAAEAAMTFGYYSTPTPEDPVGRYRYNGSRLDERPQIWAGPLIYHELLPGHHFQIALQNENEALPKYRRESFNAVAFIEGWGEYAASLGSEMGLLDDPYDQYGAALSSIFIAARLVLDTGMNSMGWSLEEARAYMAAHTFQSPTEIATETLRYSTDLNAQALAYRAGYEKLIELRARAQERAGEDWDIRDFHDAVLSSGALPMTVLEKHLDTVLGAR